MMTTTVETDLTYGASVGLVTGSIFWFIASVDGDAVTLSNGLGNRRSGRRKTVSTAELLGGRWVTYTR